MKSAMFITAAPVGAVPKYIDPFEPTFISNLILDYFTPDINKQSIFEILDRENWKSANAGGISLQFGYKGILTHNAFNTLTTSEQASALEALNHAGWLTHVDGWINPTTHRSVKPQAFKIKRDLLNLLPSQKLIKQIVLQLTTYGWQATADGDLSWPYFRVHSYLPPEIASEIKRLSPTVFETLLNFGWADQPAGYWHPGKACSPHMPISPDRIIEECHLSFQEGAALVHLHTRDTSDKRIEKIPGLGASLSSSGQANHIDLTQFDIIVPALLEQNPDGVINLSTSVRGNKAAFDSPLRRAHLKPYGVRKLVPDIASFSPGPVLFTGGGGYENPPDFIDSQLAHLKAHRIRPEVEVFNLTILNNALTTYKGALEELETPVLFMLVAGVDQQKRGAENGELVDDSLIPLSIRQRISDLLQADDAASQTLATELAIEYLSPITQRIRQCCPASIISMLMPGNMQTILTSVALALDLDGIRIGFEDALTVVDELVPGRIRKASSTSEQVRAIRLALKAQGISVITPAQLRDRLGIPREEVQLFRYGSTSRQLHI